jgi:hypothetical protein
VRCSIDTHVPLTNGLSREMKRVRSSEHILKVCNFGPNVSRTKGSVSESAKQPNNSIKEKFVRILQRLLAFRFDNVLDKLLRTSQYRRTTTDPMTRYNSIEIPICYSLHITFHRTTLLVSTIYNIVMMEACRLRVWEHPEEDSLFIKALALHILLVEPRERTQV